MHRAFSGGVTDGETSLAKPRRLDGRWIAVAILLGYFALVSVLTGSLGYAQGWLTVGVPGLQPAFADLRGLTSGGDSYRAGYDPLVQNPADFWQRTMDYPRVWLVALLGLGIHQRDTVGLGFALAAIFFASVFWFMGRLSLWQGVLWGVLLCAPSTMLGVERGNCDLVIFVLLVLALMALRQERVGPWLAYLTLGLCAVLKLYPVCAFMLAWRETPRRALRVLAVAGLAFGAYLYGTRDDLRVLAANVPQGMGISYGSRVYFDMMMRDKEPLDPALPLPALAALTAIGVAGLGRVRAPGPAPLSRAAADGLMVGGALYAATFVVSSNFNYRLVLLLFVVPALLELRRSGEALYRRLGTTLLAALVVGWWLSQLPVPAAFFIKEAANWTVFVGLAFLLWQFLPLPSALGEIGRMGHRRRLATSG